ncbi:MAG: hypothetical protein U5R06_00095 [candidate division KSB1 bacterium]|nr:hypothetical protein [candidate division KSB1 bacterium]
MKKICFYTVLLVFSFQTAGQELKKIAEYLIPEARQGVAVDQNYIYGIGTRQIAKYEKETGKYVQKWCENENGPILHLDSGVIVEDKLYCAHSNYPDIPMTSSVEIWDTRKLQHVGSHSFGIYRGSCTWIDRYRQCWWAVFAHYDKFQQRTGKNNRWTTLVQFNNEWQERQSWVFPDSLLNYFRPMSNSGGSWGRDGYLYCTGHDSAVVYVLKLPDAGSVLKWVDTLSLDNRGQGLAWDRTHKSRLYWINRIKETVGCSVLFK